MRNIQYCKCKPQSTVADLCLPFALMFLKGNSFVWIFYESHEKAEAMAKKYDMTKYAIIRKTDFLI